jgi:hypothetical protein
MATRLKGRLSAQPNNALFVNSMPIKGMARLSRLMLPEYSSAVATIAARLSA